MSDSEPLPIRSVTASDGRVWEFHVRAEVRKEEAADHITLEIATSGEVRVVSCLISEWVTQAPDLTGLLSRSVPSGASRGIGEPAHHPNGDL